MAVTMAEESTDFPGVSRPQDMGGLGFWYKWNLGWMHDTLDYMNHHTYRLTSERSRSTLVYVLAYMSSTCVLPRIS